jgi:hypothetical protein
MKKFALTILVLLLIVGCYIGYRVVRRNVLLNSGESVLLVDKSEGVYTFTELIPDDEITLSYKVIDKVNSLNEEDLSSLTEGLTLVGSNPFWDDQNIVVDLPEADKLAEWNELYSTLPASVIALCKKIEQNDFSQHCFARHAIVKIFQEESAQSNCQKLYPEEFVSECLTLATNGILGSSEDKDNNGLIDLYEFYADPLADEPNL